MIPKLTHIPRPPKSEDIEQCTPRFDNLSRHTLYNILRANPATIQHWQELTSHLSIKQGGFGILHANRVAPIAHMASMMEAFDLIRDRCNSNSDITTRLKTEFASFTASLQKETRDQLDLRKGNNQSWLTKNRIHSRSLDELLIEIATSGDLSRRNFALAKTGTLSLWLSISPHVYTFDSDLFTKVGRLSLGQLKWHM